MNKKIQKQLDKLVDDYNIMTELVIALHSGRGEWKKTKVGTIYEHFEEDVEVVANENGTLEVKNSGDYSCPISDPAIINIINALAPKPKAKKNQQPKLKEFQITYNVWGNHSDCLLSGTGTVAAKSEDEVAALVLKDFTEKDVLCDFEITNSELLHNDEETPCWNVFYTVSGKHGSYDGVGCPYTNTVKQGEKLVRMDFLEGGLDPEEEFDVEVDGEAT